MMSGFTRAPRVFLVFLIILAFLTLAMTGACSAASKSEAELRIEEGEMAVNSAYAAVLEAEKSGADVSGLLINLTYGGNFLAEAQMHYRNGDFGGAVYYADLSVQSVMGLADEAEQSRTLAMDEHKDRVFQKVTFSSMAVVVIVLGSVAGWLLFRRRYFEKVLKMKPEEV